VTGALKTQQVKSAVPGFRTHLCLNPKPVPDELNHHAVSREGGPRHLHSALREPAGAMRTVDGGHNRIDGMQVGAVAVISLPLHDPVGVWFRAAAQPVSLGKGGRACKETTLRWATQVP